METKKVINIWKEIIYIAWFYKNYLPEDKQKIEKKLNFYKKELLWSENPYSKKLHHFLEDLLLDLSSNRPLQIDTLFEDDFIGHYYDTINQVKIYNSLVDIEIYKKIIFSEDKIENNKNFSLFYENFLKNFKNLEVEKISNLLLIFTIFDLISPKKYLRRLFDFRKKIFLSFDNTKKLIKIIKIYENFLEKLHKKSLQNLRTKNISYKYIKIEKVWEEKEFELKFILQDASKDKFRTWNYIYEYREVLKNLEK